MPTSPSGPVRRAQLIAPFGVGAMVIVPGGTSLIIGGLDYWFRQKGIDDNVDSQEYAFGEWRLQEMLNVSHFRLPPDFREPMRGQKVPNVGITVPAFRFPTWHFCSDKNCRLLRSWPMYTKGTYGRIKCPECEKKKKTRYMFQVPFVAMCEHGHLQDFPWREWVHHEENPSCNKDLRLKSTGSATLAGQRVECECGKSRTLAGITSATPSGNTTLSSTLLDGGQFLCRGKKSWLGPDSKESCSTPIRGSLRSAANLYYARVLSSIYLPKSEDAGSQELEILLQSPPLSTLVSTFRDLGLNQPDRISAKLKEQYPRILAEFTVADITNVVSQLLSDGSSDNQQSGSLVPTDDAYTSFRRAEYSALITERSDKELKIVKGDRLNDPDIAKFFSQIMLVNKLRETRAFVGFTRILPEGQQGLPELQAMLWHEFPSFADRWLPANIVFGEGIFFEFNETILSAWEKRKEVIARVEPLVGRYQKLQESKHLRDRPLGPRFILIHTFAHLVMNRLVFECGYSSAALRERLFVSNNPDASMGGVLIYTADGDSEGTMGGLVRMGKPEYIEPVIRRALEGAQWCSADPVCREMGELNGQGPDSCNLAACHNCALVPETACEEFNRFLDRGVIINSFEEAKVGFFNLQ
jgi:hypothetical protein